MALLIDSPSFTANEVYEIQATDAVEGAATGASFGGLGLSNQPHQQLANRTAFLKQRQDTNVGNIAALQAFTTLVQRPDVRKWIRADSFPRRQSRFDHRDYTVGRALSDRWPRPGSDLCGNLADSISQCVYVGASFTIKRYRGHELRKTRDGDCGIHARYRDIYVRLHLRRFGHCP